MVLSESQKLPPLVVFPFINERSFIARSAIYVHRRSLLSVPTTPPTPTPPGFPKVMGLIIIGETVACTLRVIFCGDFKVPKKPEKKCVKSTFGKPGDGKVDPDFGHSFGHFFEIF